LYRLEADNGKGLTIDNGSQYYVVQQDPWPHLLQRRIQRMRNHTASL